MRLLFVTSNRLGDAVLSTGLLGCLLEQYPDARVTIVAGPASAALFDAVPGLEQLITIRKKPLHGHWFGLWAQLFSTKWDVAVDLRRSALLPMLAANRKLVVPKANGMVHRVRLLGDTVGRASSPPEPRLWWQDSDDRTAEETVMPAKGPVLAIGPTANWRGKTWPSENFVSTAAALTEPGGLFPNARIAIFGAPGEQDQTADVIQSLPAERVLDLVGKLPVPSVAACLSKCALYIGNDSGLMHMAAAAGTPTLGLFGPSHAELYAPWGSNTQAVRTPESYADLIGTPGFNRHTCDSLMTGLKVETVVKAATTLIETAEPREISANNATVAQS